MRGKRKQRSLTADSLVLAEVAERKEAKHHVGREGDPRLRAANELLAVGCDAREVVEGGENHCGYRALPTETQQGKN